jgi:hypothetical protein
MTESLSHGAATGGDNQDQRDEPADGREMDIGSLLIRGMVRDSLGVALPRAVVTLTLAGGRQLEKVRSGEDGLFQLTAPSHGEYLLAAYSPQLGEQSIMVQLNGHAVEVEFRIAVPGAVAD